MNSNAKRQTNFRKRKFVENNRQEYEQFINVTPSSSLMSDAEKYDKFHAYRKKVKLDERKRKRNEADRERRKNEVDKEIGKLKRAEAARERYRQNKIKREQQTYNEEHEDIVIEPPLKKFVSDNIICDRDTWISYYCEAIISSET